MEKYQTIGPRFVASFVDGLIFLPLTLVNYAITSLDLPPLVLQLWGLIMTLASPFYMIVMHGLYGQTFGKMAGKVKVVDLNENPITFHHAVLRSMPQIFFSLMLIFLTQPHGDSPFMQTFANLVFVSYFLWSILDIIIFFINDKRRALHDFIAGTVVINVK